MQAVKDGLYDQLKEFNPEELQEMLKQPNVDHVQVFPGTEENIIKAKKRTGKKFKYKCGHGFKKAPRIKNK
ncbi:hypothetical protein [Winogradskyella forsetii]|uniref:hypothetical protein n=1 Tax=Winogradskyella forsetii TaxID=2686077 RepID=UPI0015BC9B8D|nr:hypothetical protein [Winogradskyella forsetii]